MLKSLKISLAIMSRKTLVSFDSIIKKISLFNPRSDLVDMQSYAIAIGRFFFAILNSSCMHKIVINALIRNQT